MAAASSVDRITQWVSSQEVAVDLIVRIADKLGVAHLPPTDELLPAAFLCRLLHAAVTAEASAKTCRDMELRVAAVLDQATAADLLGVALDGAGDRVRNADTVRRVVTAFVERQQPPPPQPQEGGRVRRPSLAGGGGPSAGGLVGVLEKVARTVDEVAAESLPISNSPSSWAWRARFPRTRGRKAVSTGISSHGF